MHSQGAGGGYGGYHRGSSWFDKAAIPPSAPEAAAGMRRIGEPSWAMSSLKVQVLDTLHGDPSQAIICFEYTFPPNFTSDGPFTKDLRQRLFEANVFGSENSDLVVTESWGGAGRVITRAHTLNPMDSLRHFGGVDEPIQVQLSRRDGHSRCVCGLAICPRNLGVASKGATVLSGFLPSMTPGTGVSTAVMMRASYPQYNSVCYSCKKVTELREFAFPASTSLAKRDEHCQECGHLTYHNEIL